MACGQELVNIVHYFAKKIGVRLNGCAGAANAVGNSGHEGASLAKARTPNLGLSVCIGDPFFLAGGWRLGSRKELRLGSSQVIGERSSAG